MIDEVKFSLKSVEEKGKKVSEKGDNALMWRARERGEEGFISRDIWVYVNKLLFEEGRSVSHVSIINVMNDMVDVGFLTQRRNRVREKTIFFRRTRCP